MVGLAHAVEDKGEKHKRGHSGHMVLRNVEKEEVEG